MRDVADARQSLPPEAVSRYVLEVVEFAQFGRGEALAHDVEVVFADSGAVVLDLERGVSGGSDTVRCTCSSFKPPFFTVIWMLVLWASRLFSIISLSALAGRWMISPAAIRLITASSSFLISRGSILFEVRENNFEFGGFWFRTEGGWRRWTVVFEIKLNSHCFLQYSSIVYGYRKCVILV